MLKLLIIGNNTGSKYYRYIPGGRYLQDLGHQVMIADHDDKHLQERIEQSDVVLFQMAFSPELIRYAKRLGKRVVVEADDLLHRVGAEHYSHKELSGLGSLRWYLRVWRCLWHADLFVTTTEELRRKYGWMCKRSAVWANRCDIAHWIKPERHNASDQVRILWAGSSSHTEDLRFIAPVMKRVLERHPEVKFLTIGHGGAPTDDLYTQFVYGDNDIFADLPKGSREMICPVPANVWPAVLAGIAADIAIAPLVKTEFSRMKSQCKFIEYGINGIPGVYAGWFYTDVNHGEDGLLADTPLQWEAAIELLITDVTYRRRLGVRARERILNDFDVRPHLKAWGDMVLGCDSESV